MKQPISNKVPVSRKTKVKKKKKMTPGYLIRVIFFAILMALLGVAVAMKLWHFYSSHYNK